MATRLVGRIRLGDSVSPEVAKLFSRFPQSMDRIEVFDNSVPNDPAPPCKAAALVHRSLINVETPSITILRQKVFDYNNRDFHASQLQSLVDSVASNYLKDQGGGVQLTVHRYDQSSASLADIQVFAKTKETCDHKNLMIVPFVKLWFRPWIGLTQLKQETNTAHANEDCLGLSSPLAQYSTEDGQQIDLLSIDRIKRRLVCAIRSPGDPFAIVNSLLLKHLCYEATVVVSEHGMRYPRYSGALVINKRLVGKNVKDMNPLLIHPEFIDC